MDHRIDYQDIEAVQCMGIFKQGPYHEIGPAFRQLGEALSAAGLWGKVGPVMGLYLDNPQITAPEDCRAYAAVSIVDADVEWPAGFEPIEAGGGHAAVMTVNGPYEQLPHAWMSIGPRVFNAETGHCPAPVASREIYVAMDLQDPSKNVTRIIQFVQKA